MRVPLYTSGRVSHGIAAAQSNCGAAQNDLHRSVQDLKLQLAFAYAGVLRGERGCQVAEAVVSSLGAHQHEVNEHYQNQFVSQNDALAAEVALANARQDLLRAQNELDLARSEYNRLVGRPLNAPVRLQELLAPEIHPNLTVLTDRALRRRPEALALAARSQSLQHQADSLRAETKPQVELRGAYAYEENRYQVFPGIASAALTVDWNAFDGGRKKYRATAADYEAQAARRLHRDVESVIALEVRRAVLEVDETRQRLAVRQRAVAQAEENLRVNKQLFSQRRATNTEVLSAEALRAKARTEQYNSVYDAALAVLRLQRAVGDL
jgi:outer membrane protein TolC